MDASTLLSKGFREVSFVRAFVRRVYLAFAADKPIPVFRSDDLVENETDRLDGKSWLHFALDPSSRPMYSSDLVFLKGRDLVYWLPAFFIQATFFEDSLSDLPSNLQGLFLPGSWLFRPEFRAHLDSSQVKVVLSYLRIRQIRIRKLYGRSPWSDADPILRDCLKKDCEEIDWAISYWSAGR